MNLLELIKRVGVKNIGVQLLPQCILSSRIVNDRGEITFQTDPAKALGIHLEQPQFIALVLWIPVKSQDYGIKIPSPKNGKPK